MARVPVGETVHLPSPTSSGGSGTLVSVAHTRAAKARACLSVEAGEPSQRLSAQVRQVADDFLVAAPWLAIAGQRGGRLVELAGTLLRLH